MYGAGKSRLFVIEGTMKKEAYCDMLAGEVEEMTDKTTFEDDHAKPHTAHKAQYWKDANLPCHFKIRKCEQDDPLYASPKWTLFG